MKNKKLLLILLSVLVITIIALGCAQEPLDEENNDNVTDIEENNGNDTNMEENNDIDNEQESVDTNVEQSLEGNFVGWIDANSFEVMKDDTPYVIRTSDDVVMPDDALEGRNVRITYTRNDQGQNIIKTIEVIE